MTIAKLTCRYPGIDFLVAEGYDEAILGVEENEGRIVYSVSKIILILIERDGMNMGDAVEFFDFNVRYAHMGKKTPIWCDDFL